MIFAPTHPLCHMAYECGVGAQKRFSRFAGPKTVLRIWRFLLFRIWMLSLLAPLLLGAHGFFFSLAELFATEAPLRRSFFIVFCKKKRGPSPLFSFFSSRFSFLLSERVAHALLTGEGILLAHLPSTNVILERVSLCRPVPEKHLV